MSKQKPTMLTAKYDMKMLKQIVEIDDGMKGRLCELVGVEDEVCAVSLTTKSVLNPLVPGLLAGCRAKLGLTRVFGLYGIRGESRADESFCNTRESRRVRASQSCC